MKEATRAVILAILLSLWTARLGAQAAVAAEPRDASPSLQEQVDALREGQRRILQELAELKNLVQENGARGETPAKPAAAEPKVIALNVRGEPFRGDAKARVALVEFSDFECSFCAKYVRETFPRIDKAYIQTGKIKYLFRDLPDPLDTNALLKARAARCAGEQGKFWEMHDRLFAAQSETNSQDILAPAGALGLDIAKLNACLSTERYVQSIRSSMAGAKRNGIYGTPAFLIGTASEDGNYIWATKLVVGGDSFEVLQADLDEVLASASANPPQP